MNTPRMHPDPGDEAPNIPGFRSWRAVYWTVFVVFVLIVILMAWFSSAFA